MLEEITSLKSVVVLPSTVRERPEAASVVLGMRAKSRDLVTGLCPGVIPVMGKSLLRYCCLGKPNG
jgi:hypothetical protein